MTTAATLFHRFYYQASFLTWPLEDVCVAVTIIACKSTESLRKSRQVILAFDYVFKEYFSTKPFLYKSLSVYSEEFALLKQRVDKCEMHALNFMGFNVQVYGCYSFLTAYCKCLEVDENVCERAFAFANDSYRTVACVLYQPFEIACSCIWLAMQEEWVLPENWNLVFGMEIEHVEKCALIIKEVTRMECVKIPLAPSKIYELLVLQGCIQKPNEILAKDDEEKEHSSQQRSRSRGSSPYKGRDDEEKHHSSQHRSRSRDASPHRNQSISRDTKRRRSRSKDKSPVRDRNTGSRHRTPDRYHSRHKSRSNSRTRSRSKSRRRSRSKDRFRSYRGNRSRSHSPHERYRRNRIKSPSPPPTHRRYGQQKK